MYATGVGLVMYGSAGRADYAIKKKEKKIVSKFAKKLERWFNDFF